MSERISCRTKSVSVVPRNHTKHKIITKIQYTNHSYIRENLKTTIDIHNLLERLVKTTEKDLRKLVAAAGIAQLITW